LLLSLKNKQGLNIKYLLKKLKILVLPDAGPQNPFQYQMIGLLESNGYLVTKAAKRRFFATISAFRQHQPDILYYDWIQSFILGKTLLITLIKCVCFFLEIQYITRVKKKPVFHTLHNMQNHAGLWLPVEKRMYTWFLRKCTRIRVYSLSTKDKIVQRFGLPPHKIHIIEDVPFHYYYPNKATKEASREFLGVSIKQYVYLFLGMIKPYKGIEDLISAFLSIKTDNDLLVIAGASDNPGYVRHLRSMITSQQNNILFVNKFIPPEQVQFYFNAANMVVLPFKNIEHSGSLDLAMSFAKPIITLRTDFTIALLAHQQELLFTSASDLKEKLFIAKTIEEETIGRKNFSIADNSNYREFLSFFNLNRKNKTVDTN
jgi:glycosyltransferase involved in cell wall biosynthesis